MTDIATGFPTTRSIGEYERAETAIAAFALTWGLPLNPEDCATIAHAALEAAHSPDTLTRVWKAARVEARGDRLNAMGRPMTYDGHHIPETLDDNKAGKDSPIS